MGVDKQQYTSPQGAECITPYGDNRDKHEQVQEMFDSIAPAYDFMNRAMTLGIDKLWRRRAVNVLKKNNVAHILDVATGTGDLAVQIVKSIPGSTVTGVDLSEGMLAVGREKVKSAGLDRHIDFIQADCLSLPFEPDTFDAVTVAYGVRNFERLSEGYREMYRVLKPGGVICVLELSTPSGVVTRPLYNIYTRYVIPAVGRLISKDVRAYSYLPESIAAVAQRRDMCDIMSGVGFLDATFRSMTMGVCTLYLARK